MSHLWMTSIEGGDNDDSAAFWLVIPNISSNAFKVIKTFECARETRLFVGRISYNRGKITPLRQLVANLPTWALSEFVIFPLLWN